MIPAIGGDFATGPSAEPSQSGAINSLTPRERPKQIGIPLLDPDREAYLGGDLKHYNSLDMALGPSAEDEIPEDALDFYTQEFANDQASINLHTALFGNRGAYNALEADRVLGEKEFDPNLYAWTLKYSGYIPSDWAGATAQDLIDSVSEISAYIDSQRAQGLDPKIHPLLLDALIEYSYLPNEPKLAYEVGRTLDLELPQLVRLYKNHYKETGRITVLGAAHR